MKLGETRDNLKIKHSNTYHHRIIQSSRLQLGGNILIVLLALLPHSIIRVHSNRANVSIEVITRRNGEIEILMHMIRSEVSINNRG